MDEKATTAAYTKLQTEFVAAVRHQLSQLKTEIGLRNSTISDRDSYIYGDKLERSLDIPIGHDFTPVNWLRRSVEIHKIQFMGRPFQVISTYSTKDTASANDAEDKQRLIIENKKQSEFAELRKNLVDDIIRDNGGHAIFMDGAESASAVGNWIVKTWYDEDNQKYTISSIEAVENCYALWSQDDFRSFDAFAYIQQISPLQAKERYGCDNPVTSVLGSPLDFTSDSVTSPSTSNQPMVTVMEITGKVPGWGSEKGKLRKAPSSENIFNALCIGNEVYSLEDRDKYIPDHYIFPNKKQRRRPWGLSDISDAAININLTYVETLSDWRTVSSKVNFPKFKGFNFGPDTQMPKFKSRSIQVLPLAEGQDVALLPTGDANQVDFRTQLDELKEQFVRETGISRVLFDDPSITLNSNQALLTSMKPTSDIAESKKQLWGPILQQMFTDAIDCLAQWRDDVKDLASDSWNLKVQWPSVMQKEDPIFQQMLLNRKNAGTMSIQTYLENQGETKEELDRIREEMSDPVTAAIHGNALGMLAEQLIVPPQPAPVEKPKIAVNVNSKEMTPLQRDMIVAEATTSTNDDAVNQPKQSQTSGAPPAQVTTQANNVPGTGAVSQPGSGASTTPQGAVAQAAQQNGA